MRVLIVIFWSMITERQNNILRSLVEEYTRTATPVASRLLAKKYGFDMSPATMRNELVSLERAGLIRKPHTSGGRIPTDKGYRLYVNACLEDRNRVSPRDERQLTEVIQGAEAVEDRLAHVVAKALAELSAEATLIADTDDTVYYTGFSYLMEKPEFALTDRLATLSRAIDHLDELLPRLLADAGDDPVVLIGQENPFSTDCSVVMSRYVHGGTTGLIAIVGPTRMRYETNIGLIGTTVKLIAQHDRAKHRKTK